jgi:2-hydroxy-3-keto-5-methylthiopentenyl-1-phosphate phosphatase
VRIVPKEKIDKSEEEIPPKQSKNRREIEAMLERIGVSLDHRITVVDLNSGERHLFDSYLQAMEFMKGKKGRWYVTSPGMRYSVEEH